MKSRIQAAWLGEHLDFYTIRALCQRAHYVCYLNMYNYFNSLGSTARQVQRELLRVWKLRRQQLMHNSLDYIDLADELTVKKDINRLDRQQLNTIHRILAERIRNACALQTLSLDNDLMLFAKTCQEQIGFPKYLPPTKSRLSAEVFMQMVLRIFKRLPGNMMLSALSEGFGGICFVIHSGETIMSCLAEDHALVSKVKRPRLGRLTYARYKGYQHFNRPSQLFRLNLDYQNCQALLSQGPLSSEEILSCHQLLDTAISIQRECEVTQALINQLVPWIHRATRRRLESWRQHWYQRQSACFDQANHYMERLKVDTRESTDLHKICSLVTLFRKAASSGYQKAATGSSQEYLADLEDRAIQLLEQRMKLYPTRAEHQQPQPLHLASLAENWSELPSRQQLTLHPQLLSIIDHQINQALLSGLWSADLHQLINCVGDLDQQTHSRVLAACSMITSNREIASDILSQFSMHWRYPVRLFGYDAQSIRLLHKAIHHCLEQLESESPLQHPKQLDHLDRMLTGGYFFKAYPNPSLAKRYRTEKARREAAQREKHIRHSMTMDIASDQYAQALQTLSAHLKYDVKSPLITLLRDEFRLSLRACVTQPQRFRLRLKRFIESVDAVGVSIQVDEDINWMHDLRVLNEAKRTPEILVNQMMGRLYQQPKTKQSGPHRIEWTPSEIAIFRQGLVPDHIYPSLCTALLSLCQRYASMGYGENQACLEQALAWLKYRHPDQNYHLTHAQFMNNSSIKACTTPSVPAQHCLEIRQEDTSIATSWKRGHTIGENASPQPRSEIVHSAQCMQDHASRSEILLEYQRTVKQIALLPIDDPKREALTEILDKLRQALPPGQSQIEQTSDLRCDKQILTA